MGHYFFERGTNPETIHASGKATVCKFGVAVLFYRFGNCPIKML
jgi:hypothetical protein